MTTHSKGVINACFTLRHEAFLLDVALSLPAKGVTILYGQSDSGKQRSFAALQGLRTRR
jgi:ABC-type molybdate transport system ATPase subunit